MQSSQLGRTDVKASIGVALLLFAIAAFALCHWRAGLTALAATSGGFWLVLARLRQQREAGDARLGVADELQRARQLLSRGAHRHALVVAHAAAESAQSARLQRNALELVAWCELALGRPQGARDALSWTGGSAALDPYCVAAVEDACGESLWALHIIERAARKAPQSRQACLFRIDLYARLRGVEAACALTLQQLLRLEREDVARVLSFARRAGVDCSAARGLAQVLAERSPGS